MSAPLATPTPVRAATPVRPLVLGYGNPLRTDDGVGWQVANRLAADPRAAGIRVIAAHQLAPEHAADLAAASRVVLVDAQVVADAGATAPRPGDCQVRGVEAAAVPPAGWTHHRSPEALVALARELFGPVPPVLAVGVGVESVDGGEQLTPPVAAAVPGLVDLVLALVAAPVREESYHA